MLNLYSQKKLLSNNEKNSNQQQLPIKQWNFQKKKKLQDKTELKNIQNDSQIQKINKPFTDNDQVFQQQIQTNEQFNKNIEQQNNFIKNQIVKKIKKSKPQWNQNYRIVEFSFPQQIMNEKMNKKFCLCLKYRDENGKMRKKSIKFGDKRKQDFIDNKDENIKLSNQQRLQNTSNPFHHNFWRLHLLNSVPDIRQAYINLLNNII